MVIYSKARLVKKSGKCNVKACNMKHRRLQFFLDGYTSLLECKWHLLVFIFLVTSLTSWVLFSLMWYGVVHWHRDLEHLNTPNWRPCLLNVRNIESVILFSIETQTTIGYGSHSVDEECSMGIFLLVVQSIFGAMLQALIAGTILAKIQSPARRAKTILFSKSACVCLENEELCLMVRVGNLRRSEVVSGHIRALFLDHKLTKDDDFLPQDIQEMSVSLPQINPQSHLWWPATIVHKIDEASPLYGISPEKLQDMDFEIIILLEGSIASTSMTFQGRTSYTPCEIKWGYRFCPIFETRNQYSEFHELNFDYFDLVRPVDKFPNMSASEMANERLQRRCRIASPTGSMLTLT